MKCVHKQEFFSLPFGRAPLKHVLGQCIYSDARKPPRPYRRGPFEPTLCQNRERAFFALNPQSIDAVRQPGGEPRNGAVYVYNQSGFAGRPDNRLTQDQEVRPALGYRQYFSARKMQVHFDAGRVAG